MATSPAEYSELSVAKKRQRLESLILMLSTKHAFPVKLCRGFLWSSRREPCPDKLFELLKQFVGDGNLLLKIQNHPYLELYWKNPN